MPESTSRTRSEQKEQTKRKIVDAVTALIREQGQFTVAEVCERSEISPATVYRYYPDRAALVEAVALVDTYLGARPPTSLAEWRAWIAEVWNWFEENFDRVFAAGVTPAGREMRASRMRNRVPSIERLLRLEGIDPESPQGKRLLALCLILPSSSAYVDVHEVLDLGAADGAESVGWAITALSRATKEGWEIGDGLD